MLRREERDPNWFSNTNSERASQGSARALLPLSQGGGVAESLELKKKGSRVKIQPNPQPGRRGRSALESERVCPKQNSAPACNACVKLP